MPFAWVKFSTNFPVSSVGGFKMFADAVVSVSVYSEVLF
jgi:hypothetical protein